MGMKSSIKPSRMPAPDDLEGWKEHIKGLERQLAMAKGMVLRLENELEAEAEAVDEPETEAETEGSDGD